MHTVIYKNTTKKSPSKQCDRLNFYISFSVLELLKTKTTLTSATDFHFYPYFSFLHQVLYLDTHLCGSAHLNLQSVVKHSALAKTQFLLTYNYRAEVRKAELS